MHFADACASLWIDGELVHLEDLVLHDATRDIRTPAHELTIARDCVANSPTRRHTVARLGPFRRWYPDLATNVTHPFSRRRGDGVRRRQSGRGRCKKSGRGGEDGVDAEDLPGVD
ncbi:conserved protein of unknown function [Agrobacterium pusense]|uniref:Uncharacterized protein n=1 Tax=Agrobacterium pusense TaxID=648995 RepID=U4QBC9_9HYPH|nr:conserved protein of unknown function [Agrobacterium pusense]